MLPACRRIGAHMPLGGGMVKAAERAHAIGATTIQVFADNPTAWKRRASLPRELPRFRETLERHDIRPLTIHAPYLANPAGNDELFFERSCAVLSRELEVAEAYAAAFVNVHVGSHLGAGVEAGAERVAEAAVRTLGTGHRAAGAPKLVLENSAGGGFGLGTSVDELELIARAVDRRGVARDSLGFCIDTAHAWGAGLDLRDPSVTDAFLADFDGRVGLDRLVLVHLNDSRSELDSRHDRHEHVGAGRIGQEGLRHVLTHPSLGHVAFVVETPGMDEGYDAINVRRAIDLAEGRELDPLPAEAFTLRSARSKGVAPAPPDDESTSANDGAGKQESAPGRRRSRGAR